MTVAGVQPYWDRYTQSGVEKLPEEWNIRLKMNSAKDDLFEPIFMADDR